MSTLSSPPGRSSPSGLGFLSRLSCPSRSASALFVTALFVTALFVSALFVTALSALLMLSGCGGDDAGESTALGGPGGATADPILQYAQCMRDNGVSMADPKTGDPASLYDGVDTTSPAFTSADAACGHLIASVVQERGDLDPEQQQEEAEEMLALAECLREQGIDVPDPVVGQPGGPFGGTIDRNDPQTSAALQECQQASTDAG